MHRNRPRAAAAAALCALFATATPTLAGENITTLTIPMPEAPLGFFGVEYLQDFFQTAPDEPLQVVEMRMNVNFNTSAAVDYNDAQYILFQLQLPTEDVPFWNVSGADLGWQGTGEFTGSLSTTEFNAPLLFVPDADFILWLRRIVSEDPTSQLLGGQLTDSYWEIDLAPIPAPGAAALLGICGMHAFRRKRPRS